MDTARIIVVFILLFGMAGCCPRDPVLEAMERSAPEREKLDEVLSRLGANQWSGKSTPVEYVVSQLGEPDLKITTVTSEKLRERISRKRTANIGKGESVEIWFWHPAIRAGRIEWAHHLGKGGRSLFGSYIVHFPPELVIAVKDGMVVEGLWSMHLNAMCMTMGIEFSRVEEVIEANAKRLVKPRSEGEGEK